jgi:UDP-sugar pyrophosphorylase
MHLDLLDAINQQPLIEAYRQASPQEQEAFDHQISRIEKTYPGGLRVYHRNAVKLLKESAEGVNPYANYIVGKPQGLVLSYNDLTTWEKYEALGLKELDRTCFMLVAGGLGERLGYPGIKVRL